MNSAMAINALDSVLATKRREYENSTRHSVYTAEAIIAALADYRNGVAYALRLMEKVDIHGADARHDPHGP